MTRLQETLASIPLATRSIVGVCVLTYAYQLLFDPPLHHFTLCPKLVLYQHEFYRIVTSALFHANLMHIAMNMMSTMAIGGSLERQLGTLMLGITILWGIVLTSTIYMLISWLLQIIFGYDRMMLQHSVGFSGVIFQLSVLESSLSPNRTRSVFGVFTVSSKMYPWALLVALQFIMPQISFLGHLSGILVGTLQYFGVLDKIFPSETYLREKEMSDGLGAMRRQPGYVMIPEAGFSTRENPDLRAAFLGAFGSISLFVGHVFEAVKVCIFGRGAEANSNIQLEAIWGSSDATAEGAGLPDIIEEDEEWVGLPAAIQRSTEEM